MDNSISDDFLNSILDEIEKSKIDQISMAEEGKYLTFNLAGETYGILILKVREIIKILPITCVVQGSNSFRGVINLRDQVIPVCDLRALFGLEKIDHTDQTCIIVVEIWYELKLKQVGIIVDSVSEVLNITEEDFEEVPETLAELNIFYLLAMANIKGKLIIILNTDNLLRNLT